jgi:undecaprenyl-diphosphatase
VRVKCGNAYSFTSSHATNHFAIATFLSLTLGKRFKKIKWPLLTWAGMICLAQVYVGVHFPLDVFCGAILGMIIGWLWSFVFNNNFKFFSTA